MQYKTNKEIEKEFKEWAFNEEDTEKSLTGKQAKNVCKYFISIRKQDREAIGEWAEKNTKVSFQYKMATLPNGQQYLVGEQEWHAGHNQALTDLLSFLEGLEN